MPMEIHDDKIIMRAINTLSDFASPDRITDLSNLVQQIEAQNG